LLDFAAHNAEQAAVWQAYYEGKPTRVPMILGISTRFTVLNSIANPEGETFEDYFLRPEVMFRHQLRKQHFIRHYLTFDQEMGLPERWGIAIEFQNSYDAMCFGCPLHFRPGQVPDTTPILGTDNKRELFDRGIPDFAAPDGWCSRAYEYKQQFDQWASDQEFEGRPISVGSTPGVGLGDGIMTLACALRDPTAFLLDFYEDPDYVHELLGYCTEALLARFRLERGRCDLPLTFDTTGIADDAIQMLSEAHYREFVLPYHKRILAEVQAKGPNSIHLCGDATRHFRTIRDELNIHSFDTGFPVDFGWLREQLGPGVTIYGGPHVEIVRSGPPELLVAETRRILDSGIREGGKFVLREGNNLAPYTPLENVTLMYNTCREYGKYE
jgi:hypothetical protein